MRFPVTEIPAIETNYLCVAYDMSTLIPENLAGRELHMIATQSIIDNEEVMHHTLLFACDDISGSLYL